MPEYSFRHDDGTETTAYFRMAEAPPIGSRLRINGRWATRIVDSLQTHVQGDRRVTSKSLPFNWPFAPRHNERGEPQFQSQREIDEACAKAQHAGEDVFYE